MNDIQLKTKSIKTSTYGWVTFSDHLIIEYVNMPANSTKHSMLGKILSILENFLLWTHLGAN